MTRPRFLLEDHLGKLARWLRFLDYDAAMYHGASFTNLARLAVKERRILLTRSEKHAKSDWKFGRQRIIAEDYIDQLKELKELIELDEAMVGNRCMECNRTLYPIDKAKAKGLVPEYVLETQDHLLICRKCGRVYWRGTHWEKMLVTLRALLKRDTAEQA